MSNTWKAVCVRKSKLGYWNIGDIISVEDGRVKCVSDCFGNILDIKMERLKSDRYSNITCLNLKLAGEWELLKREESVQIDPIKPKHYNSTKISTFDIVNDWGLNFFLGNVVKYIQRAGKKEGNSELQDLKKANEYLTEYIKMLEVK